MRTNYAPKNKAVIKLGDLPSGARREIVRKVYRAKGDDGFTMLGTREFIPELYGRIVDFRYIRKSKDGDECNYESHSYPKDCIDCEYEFDGFRCWDEMEVMLAGKTGVTILCAYRSQILPALTEFTDIMREKGKEINEVCCRISVCEGDYNIDLIDDFPTVPVFSRPDKKLGDIPNDYRKNPTKKDDKIPDKKKKKVSRGKGSTPKKKKVRDKKDTASSNTRLTGIPMGKKR